MSNQLRGQETGVCGHGLGHRLMRQLIDYAEVQNYRAISLLTINDHGVDHKASFWRRFGFIKSEKMESDTWPTRDAAGQVKLIKHRLCYWVKPLGSVPEL